MSRVCESHRKRSALYQCPVPVHPVTSPGHMTIGAVATAVSCISYQLLLSRYDGWSAGDRNIKVWIRRGGISIGQTAN